MPSSHIVSRDADDEPLLQAAGVVADAVCRAHQEPTENARALVGLLRPRLHTFIGWPTVCPPVEPPMLPGEQAERDVRVRDYALSQAARYLSEHRATTDPLTEARVATLDRLVFAAQFDEASSFVHSDELMLRLNELRLPFPVSKRWLSSEIIGPLRDDGVVITGSGRGYAIPFHAAELDEHVRDVRSKAIPMLRRLALYRSGLSVRTGGDIDLLASPRLADIKLLLETLNGFQSDDAPL